MGSDDGRKKRLKHLDFIFMNHWGGFYLLPSLSIDIVYGRATWTFVWLVFRVDYKSYKRLPDWFMEYVWSVMNFDFLKKKED